MNKTLQILMVIAQNDFRDEEYLEPKKFFEEHGFKVMTTSERKGECSGTLGAKVWAEIALNEVDSHNYRAVIFVGGMGASHYFADEEALSLAREIYQNDGIVAAICIAPTILANAKILQGKRVTAFETEKKRLEDKGATYTGNPVEVDGQIVTADGPDAAEEFAHAILKVATE